MPLVALGLLSYVLAVISFASFNRKIEKNWVMMTCQTLNNTRVFAHLGFFEIVYVDEVQVGYNWPYDSNSTDSTNSNKTKTFRECFGAKEQNCSYHHPVSDSCVIVESSFSPFVSIRSVVCSNAITNQHLPLAIK